MLAAGFQHVSLEVHTAVFTDATILPMLLGLASAATAAGAIAAEQADGWTAEQRHRAQTGRLFVAIPMFLASAQA